MALTEVERLYLTELKNKGFSKEEAVKALDEVRLKKNVPAEQKMSVGAKGVQFYDDKTKFETEGAPEKVAIAAALKKGGASLTPTWQGTKQIGKDVGSFIATAGNKAAQFPVEATENIVKFLSPKAGGVEEFLTKPFEKIKETVSIKEEDPMYSKAGEAVGGVLGDIAATALPAGAAYKGASKLFKPLTSQKGIVGGLGKAGEVVTGSVASTAAMTPFVEGRLPNLAELGTGGVIDIIAAYAPGLGTLGKSIKRGAQKGVDLMTPTQYGVREGVTDTAEAAVKTDIPESIRWTQEPQVAAKIDDEIQSYAQKAAAVGVPEEAINETIEVIQKNPEIVDDFISSLTANRGFKTTASKGQTPKTIEILGDNVKTGIKQLEELKKNVGKQIGSALDGMGGTISTEAVFNNLKQKAEKIGIDLKKLETNPAEAFATSKIRSDKGDQALFMDVYDLVKPTVKDGNVTYKEFTWPQLQNIDQNYGKLLSQPAEKKGFSATGGALITALREDLFDSLPESLKNLKAEYKEIIKPLNTLKQKAGNKLVKMPAILRRSWSDAASEYKEIIDELQSLADKYGIKDLDNLNQKAFVALAFDNAKTARPAGLPAAVSKGTEAVTKPFGDTVSNITRGTGEVIDAMRGLPADQIEALSTLAALAKVKSAKIGMDEAVQTIQEITKLSIPDEAKAALANTVKLLLNKSAIKGAMIGASLPEGEFSGVPLGQETEETTLGQYSK